MDTLLYQFQFSHYCEKARWALDYKGLPYQVNNLLPGLHRLSLRGKVKATSLPVLRVAGTYIQGSDFIIDHLDQAIPARRLTPALPDQRAEAAQWESFASTELANPFTVFHYSHMLDTPGLLRQRYTQDGPWFALLYYAVTFKRLCQVIREMYKIDDSSGVRSRATIEAGLHKLEQHLNSRSYLVGNQFSRADLSVAALLSPLAVPEQLAANTVNTYPALAQFQSQFADSPVIQWVKRIYHDHRQ